MLRPLPACKRHWKILARRMIRREIPSLDVNNHPSGSMYTTYNLFKFLHIVAAIIWIGGVIAISILNMRLARADDRTGMAAMARQGRFFGSRVAGPAAGITLIAGMVMVAVSGIGFPFWITWGFIAILLSFALGTTFLRRAGAALSEQLGTGKPVDLRLLSLQRRLAILSTINVLLLLSAVWAMVFKPML